MWDRKFRARFSTVIRVRPFVCGQISPGKPGAARRNATRSNRLSWPFATHLARTVWKPTLFCAPDGAALHLPAMAPTILVSNDDGYRSAGIRALVRRLSDLGRVIVVAPDRERSATSHAFTLDRPLRCERIEE